MNSKQSTKSIIFNYFIGGSDGELVTQEDTIFVSGMANDIDEEALCKHFGAIGIIKVKFPLGLI